MGWREFQTSIPLDNIDKIDNMREKSHKVDLVDLVDLVDKDGEIKTVDIYCSWGKKGVPMSECHKPKSCFYRDDKDRLVECQHLKAFIRRRNKELGL